MKNAGWDFGIGGSQSTGTVRSAVRPPLASERRLDDVQIQTSQRTPEAESGDLGFSAPGNVNHASLEVSSRKDAREAYNHEHRDNYHGEVIIFLASPISTPASLFVLEAQAMILTPFIQQAKTCKSIYILQLLIMGYFFKYLIDLGFILG